MRPLGRLLGMPEQGNALILKEGVVAVVEDVAKVLPICLSLHVIGITISWMVL